MRNKRKLFHCRIWIWLCSDF